MTEYFIGIAVHSDQDHYVIRPCAREDLRTEIEKSVQATSIEEVSLFRMVPMSARYEFVLDIPEIDKEALHRWATELMTPSDIEGKPAGEGLARMDNDVLCIPESTQSSTPDFDPAEWMTVKEMAEELRYPRSSASHRILGDPKKFPSILVAGKGFGTRYVSRAAVMAEKQRRQAEDGESAEEERHTS